MELVYQKGLMGTAEIAALGQSPDSRNSRGKSDCHEENDIFGHQAFYGYSHSLFLSRGSWAFGWVTHGLQTISLRNLAGQTSGLEALDSFWTSLCSLAHDCDNQARPRFGEQGGCREGFRARERVHLLSGTRSC